MPTLEDHLDDDDEAAVEQAKRESRREKTKWGDRINSEL